MADDYSGALACAAMGNPYIYGQLIEAVQRAVSVLGWCHHSMPESAIDVGFTAAIAVMGPELWAARDALMVADRDGKLAIVDAITSRAGLAAARATIDAARMLN